jgi:hypothetical protein
MYDVNESTEYVEEKSHKFYLLTFYDRQALLAQIKTARREAMLANLTMSNATDEQKFGELENFNDNWNDEQEFIRFVNSADADTALLERALHLDDVDAARKIIGGLRIKRPQLLALKAAIAGLDLVSPEGEGSANPPETPATNPASVYRTAETGGANAA